MSINAIGSNYHNQPKGPAATEVMEQEKPDSGTEINKLSSEIKQAETEMKETTKEVQRAMEESTGGSSEKVQMLQNKIQMQQQAILIKQMKIKEIESPSKATAERGAADTVAQRRVDQYVAGEGASSKPDNVYHVEKKDGRRTIVFNRSEN